MKRLRIFGFVLAMLLAFAGFARGQGVEQWGVYEVVLKGPANLARGNPFLDVEVSAMFTDGRHSHEVAGFYDGDGVYRIRFMPEAAGEWSYRTISDVAGLSGSTGRFTVTAATGLDHGPVRVSGTYHFAYADGTPYRELGTTSYSWWHQTDALEEETLRTLASSPFNKIRMCVLPRSEPDAKPMRFPFEGKPPMGWDYSRFNPEFFQHLEKRIGELRDLGIEADLILLNPYCKQWGFDKMSKATDERYLRYVVARFGAYRNVWWSMANEYDLMRSKTEGDWDDYFKIVQASDSYGHLLSIHNSEVIYNNAEPWVTHASIQNGSAVEDAGRAELYRDVWRKPVVYDEVKYEGNIERRWGQLSGEEMVERFWAGTVAGTYVGHGECLKGPDGGIWLFEGGVLRGESPERLAFLKKVLETSPAEGIEPIDQWQDSDMGGEAGSYYLLYFGDKTPATWTFRLYKKGVSEGMRFKVDVIDTWGMTIAPVAGEFVAKKEGEYSFVDATGRAVTLPGRRYMALRITRIGGP